MKAVDILKMIEKMYANNLGVSDTRTFQANINQSNLEVSFYHYLWHSDLKVFKDKVKSVNSEILQYIQSNYFYKVISFKEALNEKHMIDGIIVLINRIQITTVEKTPKNSHLAVIKNLKDMYV